MLGFWGAATGSAVLALFLKWAMASNPPVFVGIAVLGTFGFLYLGATLLAGAEEAKDAMHLIHRFIRRRQARD